MMSATPIPRTLAMTFYADLDVCIDELPPGRTPVATQLVADARRDEVIERMRDKAARGAAGVLGVSADRGVREARAAERADDARGAVRPRCRAGMIGLVHGRMKPTEKAR